MNQVSKMKNRLGISTIDQLLWKRNSESHFSNINIKNGLREISKLIPTLDCKTIFYENLFKTL